MPQKASRLLPHHEASSNWFQISQSSGSVFVTCFCSVGGSGTPGVSADGGPGSNGTGFDISSKAAAATGMLFGETTTQGDWHRLFCAVGESWVSRDRFVAVLGSGGMLLAVLHGAAGACEDRGHRERTFGHGPSSVYRESLP